MVVSSGLASALCNEFAFVPALGLTLGTITEALDLFKRQGLRCFCLRSA